MLISSDIETANGGRVYGDAQLERVGGSMAARIFVTGGTFDKSYDEIAGSLSFRATHLREMLALGRCRLDVEIKTLMLIDSLEMTHPHRAKIVASCRSCAERQIVITHGTDTMATTARALIDARLPDKTIVLTGAMIPYEFGSSDGLFNLGAALAFAQALPAGVHVAMNGLRFDGDNVEKDRATGRFRPVRGRPGLPQDG